MAKENGKATAVAHSNIALVKYWGKRNEALVLPWQSSLSVTLAPLEVKTTVAFGAPEDNIRLNGKEAKGSERARVIALADVVRKSKPQLGPLCVHSEGNFPASAGLASSAAAFAALALALREAAGLEEEVEATSLLARLGSGSACRSIQGGVCVWHRGEREDGADSFARQHFAAEHWPNLRMVAVILSREEKAVNSRDGMRNTVQTSPYYPAWVKAAEADIGPALEAIGARDIEKLGTLAERNAWRMHATSFAATPPLSYMKPATLAILLALEEERRKGTALWFTLDAGPNPVLLTEEAHLPKALAFAERFSPLEAVVCHPGGDARLLSEGHLF
ncbi:MAG: diphosphomevalonate decarboxylase [Proteobacteria bacterium]|nr:diphosphomevalonate decarboxylase [Cystobacterineae bacterium]MCL2314695.1 diphosphomevalonate decarboxylase [Pseudomonadota bacterium]